jgi:hypothetical protein
MRALSIVATALAGLIFLTLAPTNSDAGGFLHKTKQCPISGTPILPAGSRYNIDDIIISVDGATDVELHFNPARTTLVKLYMNANETFQTNFNGSVEGEKEQGLNLTCNGTANIQITIVGSEAF